MHDQTGLWIDHRKAVIVRITTDGAATTVIESRVEKHAQRGGDSPLKGAYEAGQVPADDSRQRALTGALDRYYDEIIAAVGRCDRLFVFGPGEAKGEFNARLARVQGGACVAALETQDRMTDREVVAKVRAHYELAAPRMQAPR
jgi:hypothetical protein